MMSAEDTTERARVAHDADELDDEVDAEAAPLEGARRSPLWMVSGEPELDAFVGQLDAARRRIMEAPDEEHRLVFSRSRVLGAREAFVRMIRRGEATLHRLCEQLGARLLDGAYDLSSVVFGQAPGTGERFSLTQPLAASELYAQTDLDLGRRLLGRLRMRDASTGAWREPTLVTNVVEYQPLAANPHGLFKFFSRIKAEEEIWNKVVDEIFQLDRLVRRDKALRRLSRYVKDVFGVKLIVTDAAAARVLHDTLLALRWTPEALAASALPDAPDARRLELIEVKDYLSPGKRKGSGWAAIKSVVRWCDEAFELQVQPLPNYLRERERLTRESHAGFKLRRDALRDQVAARIPLFGFYRDLLRWLFLQTGDPPPRFEGVTLIVEP